MMRSVRLLSAACMALSVVPTLRGKTVALWLFDDPPGSSAAVDASGNGYHLTIGPDAAVVAGGKFGNALDADATPEDGLGVHRYHVEAALNPGDEDWTLECWVKADPDMRDDNRIWGISGVNYIDYGRGNNMPSQRVAQQFGKLDALQVACRYLPLDGVNGWNKPTGNLKADNHFHHFAVTYDSNANELAHYYDGRQQFRASGEWHAVFGADTEEMQNAVFPPHYPMLQLGMRDAFQQWDHHELVPEQPLFKKFEGLIDEMRFSNDVRYRADFTPPSSLAEPYLRVWPERLSLVVDKASGKGTLPPLELSAFGADAIDWTVAGEQEWLKLDSRSGKANAAGSRVAVSVNTASLEPGQYNGSLQLRASAAGNQHFEIPVQLTVTGPDSVRDVADRKQLFIDDRFIETSHNIELNMNQAEKVMLNIDPEIRKIGIQPLALFHDKQRDNYRIYYLGGGGGIFIMESPDGISWRKPGPELNNGLPLIVQDGKEFSVGAGAPIQGIEGGRVGVLMLFVYDERDIPERRYKLFQDYNFSHLDGDGYETGAKSGSSGLTGIYGFYSADGVRFTPAGKRLLPFMAEVLFGANWDEKAQRYYIYVRCMNLAGADKGLNSIQGGQFIYRNGFTYQNPEGLVDPLVPENMVVPGYENIRAVARLEATDLLEPWMIDGKPVQVQNTTYASAEFLPMVAHFDKWDGFQDIYFGYVTQYPFAQDVLLMNMMTLRHFHPSRQPWRSVFADVNGPLELALAVSRDGSQWERFDRKAYMDLGLMDEFNRVRYQTGLGIIKVGSYLYQYIKPGPNLHDTVAVRAEYAEEKPEWFDVAMLGVRQRLDGFVSADAGYKGGWLTTPPIVFSGNRLSINQNCSGQGTMFVEVRDLNDQPIPGYSLADCEEITYNDVNWVVRWQGKNDISELAGRPIKLHFRMTNAKLYAFQFTSE